MLFSIIIPARNEEANISNLLQSIYAMDFDKNNYEVMVIDNGSQDNTVAIAEQYGAEILTVPQETISTLRNLGAERAKGYYLAFIDADCSVSRDWLSQAVKNIDTPGVVCFGCPPEVPENATWVQHSWYHIRKPQYGVNEVFWLESMNMFVRRDDFLAVGGFDVTLQTCEDYDLSVRLRGCGSIMSDSSLKAIHIGEAATIGHFFRKEFWRGTSNWKGLVAHGFSFREVPSVFAPAIYCLAHLIFLFCLLIQPQAFFLYVFIYFLFLAVPAGMYAYKKIRDDRTLLSVAQLALLLNIYFVARGFSIFARR